MYKQKTNMPSLVEAHRGPSKAQVWVGNERKPALPWRAINQLGYKNQARGAESQSSLKIKSNMMIKLIVKLRSRSRSQVRSRSGRRSGPRSGPTGPRTKTKDLDLGYTLKLVCHL